MKISFAATLLVVLLAIVRSFPGITDSHIGSGGLALIAGGGGGLDGSHDSYGSSLSLGGGGGHSLGGLSSGGLESLGGGLGGGSGATAIISIESSGGGGSDGGHGGGGGFTGGDHHGGVSIVSLGQGKGTSFDFTDDSAHHGKLFGGTIISSDKDGTSQGKQSLGSDLGDEYQLLSAAAHGGLSGGGGHEVSSVLSPSSSYGQGLGGGILSGGGHGLGGAELLLQSDYH